MKELWILFTGAGERGLYGTGTWLLALLSGLHTTEEWAGSITIGRRTRTFSTCNLSKGKDREEGWHAPVSVFQLSDILPKGKASAQSKDFSGKLLLAQTHMESRASPFLLKTLTDCYLIPLVFHQAV